MKKLIRKAISFCAQLAPAKVRDFLVWPLSSRLLGLGYQEKILLKDGFYMIGSMEDILSREILFSGEWKKNLWEEETLKKLAQLSKDSKQILIAGAHMGYLLLYAAKNSKGIVHSFEPIPSLYDRCKKNISLNPELEERIVLNKEALGAEAGEATFFDEGIRSSAYAYSGGHVKHNNVVKCAVTTIDKYSSKRKIKLGTMLLDIEGYEWRALDGAREMLKSKPKLILEVSPRVLSHTPITPKMIFQRLENLGYAIWFLDDRQGRIIEYSKEAEEYYLQMDYVNILAISK